MSKPADSSTNRSGTPHAHQVNSVPSPKGSEVPHITVATDVYFNAIKEEIRKGKKVIIPLKGFSMRPFVENMRDKALIAPVAPHKLQEGDAILAEIRPNFYVLHRLIRKEGNQLTLMGDGNVGIQEHCTTEHVVGRVEAFYRKGRSVPDYTSGTKWKVYSVLWMHLLPLRRYLLFLYRHLFV